MEEIRAGLEPPRFEDRKAFQVAGLVERYKMPAIEGIPSQWQRFAPHIGKIPGQVGWTCYGVCFNFDDTGNMDYLCGVEVVADSEPPAGLSLLRIEEQRYAVFSHRGHISKIANTWNDIVIQWLPASGYTAIKAPQFETYGQDFDSRTGNGVVEIWIPIEQPT